MTNITVECFSLCWDDGSTDGSLRSEEGESAMITIITKAR
jgi:hypothetical protein